MRFTFQTHSELDICHLLDQMAYIRHHAGEMILVIVSMKAKVEKNNGRLMEYETELLMNMPETRAQLPLLGSGLIFKTCARIW